jgi:hypothetical protein
MQTSKFPAAFVASIAVSLVSNGGITSSHQAIFWNALGTAAWPTDDPVFNDGAFLKNFDRWMDTFRNAIRRERSAIEKQIRFEAKTWCQLFSKHQRVEAAKRVSRVTKSEAWTTDDQARIDELNSSLNRPRNPPGSKKTGPFVDSDIEFDSKLRKGEWPASPRTIRIVDLERQLKRKAVQPWMTVIETGQMGLLQSDAKLLGIVDGDPVVEIQWRKRMFSQNQPEPKVGEKKVCLKLIGFKAGVVPGSSFRVDANLYIGNYRRINLDGKTSFAYDALVIDFVEALSQAGEQAKAEEIRQPL